MSGSGFPTIKGVVGTVPTPSVPGAEKWDAVDTVDLAETARMTEAIVSSGVDVLMTNGTFGQAATLTLPELLAFNNEVVRTVAGRTPVFAGATTLNTRDTIDRARRLRDIGADGVFVGRPMWLALDDEQIVNFYASVAEALVDTPIVAYDNASAFKGKISPTAYRGLAQIPQIVAAKHTGVRADSTSYGDDLEAVGGAFPLLAVPDAWYPTYAAFPGQVPACWSGDVACGPEPVLALRDALAAGDLATAGQIHAELAYVNETLFPGGDFTAFMQYSIQIDRAQFEAAGYITPGPARSPYTSAPAAYIEGGAEVGRRWSKLRSKYSRVSAR